MDYSKVRPGDGDDGIPADVWNALLDMLGAHRGGGGRRTPVHGTAQLNAGVVQIQNKSGQDVERFRVLALDAPVALPADDEEEFKRAVILKGIMPTGAHAGLWAVVQHSIPNEDFGLAVVSGISIARINLADKAHKAVERNAGSALLLSNATGTGQIVWVAGGAGSATNTGEQWAIVRLPMGAGAITSGEFQWQTILMVSQNQVGWDDDRTTAILEDG